MKLVVVSHPGANTNEAEAINSLFDEGLDLFHLRKPDFSEQEQRDLLKKINTNYYSRIAIHQHYSTAERFGINRIHFSETSRLKTKEEELEKWEKKKFILSTSIHSLNDHELLPGSFSYTFLGPVFESISKPGYKPNSEELPKLKDDRNRKIKIVAIGGITAANIEKIKRANFDGAALLGAIWNDTANATEVLKKCQQNANM